MSHKNCPTRKFLLQHMLAFCFEEFKPLRPVGDLGGEECDGRPHVFRKNCPTRKFLTKHMGAPLCVSRERNLNRSERGLPREVSYTMLFSVVNRLKLCV